MYDDLLGPNFKFENILSNACQFGMTKIVDMDVVLEAEYPE